MNDFIVWDKTLECFHLDGRIKLENGVIQSLGEDYSIHNGIGIKDINNKNIYADSSIVEFGYSVGEAVHIGYFYYSQDDLCYKIKILSSILRNGASNKFKGQSFLFDRGMINFKIIDTIQKNKLGLIK